MNDLQLLSLFLAGEAHPSEFEDLKVSRSRAYRVSKRAEFLRPFAFAILNLSPREFSASVNETFKTDIPPGEAPSRFVGGVGNSPRDMDAEGDEAYE